MSEQQAELERAAAYHVGIFCGFIAKDYGTDPMLIANALSLLVEEAARRCQQLLATGRVHNA